MTVSRRRMTRLSRTLLGLLDPIPVMRRRKENFAVLCERLGSHALFRDPVPGFVPFGFPMRLGGGRRNAVRNALLQAGILPAVHWENLPSPTDAFPVEHRLAEDLLTLPCDHRYGPAEMARVADVVTRALA